MCDKKQQLELDMEQWTSSKLGKEYIKAVSCPNAYLTYMQSTSCEMLDWMNHKLGRNINNLRYKDDTTLMAEREEELKNLLMRVKDKLRKCVASSFALLVKIALAIWGIFLCPYKF